MNVLLKILSLIIFLFLFFFSPQRTLAAFSFSIDNVSSTTISSGSQEIDVSLIINSLPSESFFRVALQKESGGSYYGYVKNNNGDWSAIQALSGDCSAYYRVSDTSTASLLLKFKLGEDIVVENGSYNLKAHRFTSTGNCSYTKATNDYAVTVLLSTPTSTPTPAPTNTPAPALTSTPIPTTTPTPTKTPTPTPKSVSGGGSSSTSTPKPTSPPTTAPTKILALSSQAAGGSGNINTAVSPTATSSPTPIKSGPTKKPTPTPIKSGQAAILGVTQNNLSKILIGLGIIFLATCGIIAFRSFKKEDKTTLK